MSKQTMQQAIEALQDAEEVLHFQKESKRLSTISPAIEALKAAIDATPKPEQDEEPVAFKLHPKYEDEDGFFDFIDTLETANQLQERGGTIEPLYLHPAPRKPFVRLEVQKIIDLVDEIVVRHNLAYELIAFARAIEDALKEKNK